MIGYLPAAFFIGVLTEKNDGINAATRVKQRLRMAGCFLCGALLCYAFGTAWFLQVMDGTYTLWQAVLVCVVPFVPFELIKIALASLVAVPVRQKLRRAGMLGMEEYR